MLKKIHFLLIPLILMAALSASGAPVRKVNGIRRPLFNNPAIVQRGGVFSIDIAGDRQVKQVTLTDSRDESFKLNLPPGVVGGKGDTDFSYDTAKVPADAKEALYNLTVEFADGTSDSQPHAVKVVAEFKKKFDFIAFTDIHFNTGAPDLNEARAKILESMSAQKPEFILFSGDLGSDPETYDVDYPFGYSMLVAHIKAPIYMVPGNHEGYVASNAKPPIDGMEYWDATYSTRYMSFDYGSLHIVGINNFDWEKEMREWKSADHAFFGTQGLARIMPEQWDWLTNDLKSAKTRTTSTVAFMHIPAETFAGGRTIGLKDRRKISGPNLEKFAELMNENNVTHVFIGHMHDNEEQHYGALTQLMTLTAGGGGNPEWGYRIVHVENGRVTGTDVILFAPSGKELKAK